MSQLNLGDLIYELGFANEQEFLRSLDRTLDRAEDRSERSGREAGQGFSRGMSRFIGSAALGGLIGGATAQAFGMASAAVGDFVRDLDQRAVQIQASMRKATVVFGETLPTVQEWARENANALGLTTQQAVALAAGAQDLLVPMGFVREEAVDISTTLIGLSGALAEWSGGQRDSAEVSEILTNALLGERESLKSLGISISAADVEARLAAKGQGELEGAVRQQAEAQATLELILEKSTDAQQAFADGADEPIRQMQLQKAAIQESKDALALDLIPVMQSYYEDVAPQLVDWTGQAVTVFGQFMQGFMDAKDLDPADYTFFTGMGEVFRTITDTIGGAIEKFEQWRFLVTGTNAELLNMERDQEQGFIERFGSELGQQVIEAENRLERAREAVQAGEEVVEGLKNDPLSFLNRAFIQSQEESLEVLRADLQAAEAEFLGTLRRASEAASAQNVGVYTPPLLNTGGGSAGGGNDGSGDSGGSSTTTRTTSGASAKAEKSFVQQEVEAIRLEGQRLKEVRDANLISAEQYEQEIAGHYRRLMGLFEQAATSQEQIDVLRLASGFSDELARIEEETVRRNEDLMRRQREMQDAAERSATRSAEAQRQQREETAERNEDLQRQQYQTQQDAERRATKAAARTASEREAARVKRLRDAEADARFLAQLEDRMASEQADALQRILDEFELNAEERKRLEQEVALFRKRAADEAADAVIEADRRAAQAIQADTQQAQRSYRELQDLEVERLRLAGEAREADLLAARNALDRALQDLGENLELRAALMENYRLRVAGINAAHDERESETTQEVSQLEQDLTNIALSFPRALHQGIQEGDIGGALQGALGSASDFFVDQMIQGILGPIAQNLGKSVGGLLGGSAAGAVGGGLANAILPGIGGAIFGIGASLLGGLFGPKPKPAAQRASESRASSGSPSITYQASTTLNFALGADLKDPATLAEVRALAREETLATLEQLGKLKK